MSHPLSPKIYPSLKRRPRKTLVQIFVIPLALFVFGLFGLILALLETGWVDIVAGLALSTSLVTLLWARYLKR
ncbi:hypothetical protein [Litorimonas sp.]|uniref:hypothetical protein n=1 Tax=Litorimonas sp. TaxID=1892381 RepID=UPI003A8C3101